MSDTLSLAAYPSRLSYPLASNHGYKRNTRFLQKDMDNGHTVRRRRWSRRIDEYTLEFIFTQEEFAIWEGFVEHELAGGYNHFICPLKTPLGVEFVKRVRLLDMPQQKVVGILWQVTATVQAMDVDLLSVDAYALLKYGTSYELSELVRLTSLAARVDIPALVVGNE